MQRSVYYEIFMVQNRDNMPLLRSDRWVALTQCNK